MTEKLKLAAAIQAAKWSEMSDALAAAGDRFADAYTELRKTAQDFESGCLAGSAWAASADLSMISDLASDFADRLEDQ